VTTTSSKSGGITQKTDWNRVYVVRAAMSSRGRAGVGSGVRSRSRCIRAIRSSSRLTPNASGTASVAGCYSIVYNLTQGIYAIRYFLRAVRGHGAPRGSRRAGAIYVASNENWLMRRPALERLHAMCDASEPTVRDGLPHRHWLSIHVVNS
jgi:hypothetical protein